MTATATSKTTTRKRKSDTTTTASKSKKAKVVDYTEAERLVEEIIARKGEMEIDAAEALMIAEYAKHLMEHTEALKPVEKSPEEIEEAAAKLKRVAVSGIEKQMKTGGAAWAYDGVCPDPSVFGAVLGLDGPPGFKQKRYTAEEFQTLMGDTIQGSARYNSLNLLANVTVRWDAGEGTFKFSGKYGV